MKNFETKFRVFFLPFLAISILYILVYTFLNWLILIQTNLTFSVNEMIPNFAAPLVLVWIPILIWLRKPSRVFKSKKDKDPAFGLQLFACFAIAVPTMVAQYYISTAMGKITRLDNITQIEKSEPTKYYTVTNCYVDKGTIGIFNKTSVSGKHNERFNMDIFVALPVFNRASDTFTTDCACWIGKNYSDNVNNDLSSEEKNERFKSFAQASQDEFEATDFNHFVYLERIDYGELENYQKAIKHSGLGKEKVPTVLKEVYEPFDKRSGDSFEWIFISFGIGILVILLIIAATPIDEDKLQAFKNGIEEKNTNTKEMLDVIIPQKNYVFTPILLFVNIIVFILMVCFGLGFTSFEAEDLLKWGANFRPYTMNGEWWRLLTNIFLHGGIMHLFGNMVSLLLVGIFLERIIGSAKFIIVYLLTGIIASAVSLWWHAAVVSEGASGAIFGLYGCFLALLLLKVLPPKATKSLLIGILVFVGFNLLMGLSGGIDNAAHLGGVASGFIIGLLLTPQVKKQLREHPLTEDPLLTKLDEKDDLPTDEKQFENNLQK